TENVRRQTPSLLESGELLLDLKEIGDETWSLESGSNGAASRESQLKSAIFRKFSSSNTLTTCLGRCIYIKILRCGVKIEKSRDACHKKGATITITTPHTDQSRCNWKRSPA
ncbi:nadp-dependent alcohol dehydrogenase, partial [Moniliophthora roreri]